MGCVGWGGYNPNLVSALAPFGLVEVGAEFGAELDNKIRVHRSAWKVGMKKLEAKRFKYS